MKHFHLASLTILSLAFSFNSYGQDCSVAKDALKGSYSGDCKNGKANGKGKALGADTYEGEFRNGYPDGKGTYTWKNGDVYTGAFVKGHLEGKGFMAYKRRDEKDSLVDGFWKNDKFVGRYDKTYKIYSETKQVVQVTVKFKPDNQNRVNFFVVNTTSSTASLKPKDGPLKDKPDATIQMSIDEINLSSGAFQRMEQYKYMKKAETILFNVTYPIHMKLTIGTEQIDMELFEEGSYKIDVNINN